MADYCVNHPGLTASHTADMPSAAPPYRQDVPLCSMCAGRIERIGFAVTQRDSSPPRDPDRESADTTPSGGLRP